MYRGVVWSQVMSNEKPIYKTHVWENVYNYDLGGAATHKKCLACQKEWHFMIDPPLTGPCIP